MKKAIKIQHSITYLVLICLLVFVASCKPDEYFLDVNILPAGSGTVSLSPSGGTYEDGTEVTLSPIPASDYIFTSYSGTDASFVNNDRIVMSKNMDITANFELQTMIRLQTGSGLNPGAHIYFVALSKNVNYFDLTTDEKFNYRKTDADWYIDGDVIPFTTDYKEFDLTTGKYYFLLSASGLVMVTTVTVIAGKQAFEIYGTGYEVGLNVLQNKKSSLLFEEKSRRIINYKR